MKKVRSHMSRKFVFGKFVIDQYRLTVDIIVFSSMIHITFASMLIPFEEKLYDEIRKSLKNKLEKKKLVICFSNEIPLSYFDYIEFEKILASES